MFKNYFKIAVRNILRHKFYAVINVLGLAIGLACFIMIGMWVQDELSYDKHFDKADRIYRIANDLITQNEPSPMACADPRIAEHIREEYPEIENVVRMLNMPTLVNYKDKDFLESNTFWVDSTFFAIFSYEFVKGDPKTALLQRESAVITEQMAMKLFGEEDPIGKTIYVNNEKTKSQTIPKTVTAVIKNHTAKAHFNPEVILAKFRYLEMFEYTYALFREGYDPAQFEIKVWPGIFNKYFKDEYAADGQSLSLTLQPLPSIHLNSALRYEIEPNGTMIYVYIFSVIAFFILLIAAINYMNLATARSYSRSKEVGVRKVLGATRKQLIIQFLTESVALALLALILALSLVEITLPFFNTLSEKTLSLNLLDFKTTITVIMLAIASGFIAGIYPAFFVSSFQPIKALKGTLEMPGRKFTLRKTLVVTQFSLSIIMLISTMLVSKQLAYVKTQDLGFTKDQVLLLDLDDPKLKTQTETLKAELLKNPDIVAVAGSRNAPGTMMNNIYFKFEQPTGMEPKLVTTMFVDYDYLKLMDIPVIDGNDFDKSMPLRLDTNIFIIANESAIKSLGWTYQNRSCNSCSPESLAEAIGWNTRAVDKDIHSSSMYKLRKGKCVGVVKDFHTASLHENIPPMVFSLVAKSFDLLSIKVRTNNMQGTIGGIEKVFRTFSKGYPFHYVFLDEHFNKQYAKEERTSILFKWFSGLCVFISCLGLMGLASFSTIQRTKEIGVRKISGAGIKDIILLLSKDFIRLVFIAFVIAVPIGWFVMNSWLQNFAYHTNIGILIFIVAGIAAVLIALATISFHTVKAANANPADVLKYE
jgi:putative ABC transport system permease protein